MEYWLRYFGSRRFPKNQQFYVVYTSIDHGIPFQPDSAINYWLINFKLVPTSVNLGDATSGEGYKEIRRAYVDIAKEAVAAFREVPTVMPHYTGNKERALNAAQTLLKPINCSPSLHTATPFFVYNLGLKYFPEKEPELRQYIVDVVSTIIKTKMHALVDIAFGMYLSKKIIEDKLGLDFHDLESFFTREQKNKDKIPYEHIYRMYREINELEKTMNGNGKKLPELMERYFQEMGLPRVKLEKSNCLYDLERKTLVYSPELKVRGGLF